MKTSVKSSSMPMKMVQDSDRKNRHGKIKKMRKHQKKEEDSAEIKAYLSKLQDIVPFMPKDKRLTKLEVISCVIEYIRNLRQTLGLPPSCSNGDDSDFDLMDAESPMIAALAQASAKPTAVATFTVINNSASPNFLGLPSESVSRCLPTQQTRQPLVAIANPSKGSS